MGSEITYKATGNVTAELLRTVFADKPVYEELDNGKKGKLLTGYSGILLAGGFNLGKTTDIIKLFERVCMYQEPYKGKRRGRCGVLRNSNTDFLITLGNSFSHWYELQTNKSFKYGYRIANANTRPEVTVRYPSQRPVVMPDGSTVMQNERDEKGKIIDCEITYICYAADKNEDEKKMKGGEFTWWWSNEGNITSQAAHEMGSGRNDRYPPNGATHPFWIMDVNPTHKKSWEFIQYIQSPKSDVKVIHYPSPLKFVPDEDGDYQLRGRIGRYEINPIATIHGEYSYFFNQLSKSQNFIINNVLGEYTNIQEGHVVHQEFDPELHVKECEPEPYHTLMVCVDFGVKCGATILAQNDDGNVMVLADYWCDRGFKYLYRKMIKPGLLNLFPTHYARKQVLFIGDPRTGQKKDLVNNSTSIQLIMNDGYEYAVPRNEEGAIVDNIDFRIETVDQYLQYRGGLSIHPRCEDTVDAFSFGYVRDDITGKPQKVKSGRYAEVMDALQYGLTYIDLGGEVASGSYGGGDKIYHSY